MRARALLAAALALASAGCSTKRTLRIESSPPGAKVWVDGRYRGPAPVDVPFVQYRTWTVRLEHPGYASLSREVHVRGGLDGLPIVDLPYELLVRERSWRITLPLQPLPPRPGDAELGAVLERAREFRERTHREVNEPGTPRKAGR